MTHFCKVGFSDGLGGNNRSVSIYMRQLNRAGIPFSVKSLDNVSLAIEAAELAHSSGVDHNILLEFSAPGGVVDAKPALNHSPQRAAEEYWSRVVRSLSSSPIPERLKESIWIEPVREIDDDAPGDFVGWFAYHLSRVAFQDGFKVALAGHAVGRPEPDSWRLPGYQAFLRACAERPEQLAVSLHEGKVGGVDAPADSFYPHVVGRFTWLYDACDELGIPRPTTFISKWSWGENQMPPVGPAMQDVYWLSELAARYATLRGIFLWSLATTVESGDLPGKLRQLVAPLTEYALQARFPDPPVSPRIKSPGHRFRPLTSGRAELGRSTESPKPDPHRQDDAPQLPAKERGKPRAQYPRTYVLMPPKARHEWVSAVTEATWEKYGYTVGKSPDDAGIGDLDARYVIAVNPSQWGPGQDGQGLEGFFSRHYPGIVYFAVEAKSPAQLKRLLSSFGPNDMIDQAG